jgi:hypothetical protein
MFPICFFYNKAYNWSIGFLQIVNISKLYHILGSNHNTFYVWSFQVSCPYKFLVLKMRTLLLMKYMWKTITFHCLPSSRCRYLSTKSHTYKRCGTLRKKSFSTRVYAEIHIQRPFFDNKKRHVNFFNWKSKRWAYVLVPPLHTGLWADFGNFG